MNDIMEIVKSLEKNWFNNKGVREIIKNKAMEQKGGFLSMFSGTLKVDLIGNLLTGIGIRRGGEATIKAGQDF